MTHTTSTLARPAAPPLALVLRRLAAALRAGGEADALLPAIERALRDLPGFAHASLEPAHAGQVSGFDSEKLALPLLGAGGPLGMLRLGAGEQGEFGPAQLHLAGAVADLASVALENALRSRGSLVAVDVLAVALDGLSHGVLCFNAAGALLYANAAARALLGGRVPVQWAELWSSFPPGVGGQPGEAFIWRTGGRPVQVSARRPAEDGPGAVVLADLAPRLGAFGETLAAEVYRGLLERHALALAVVSGAEGCLARLESASLRWPAGVRLGPVDADAAAVVAPGLGAGALARLLGDLAPAAAGAAWRLGIATLRLEGDTPQALLARAIAALQPLAARTLPALLACDRSAAVNEALAFILRREFSVTPAVRWERGLALLAEQPFDGVVFELPAGRETEAGDFAAQALALQPGTRPFFITDLPGPWELPALGLPSAPVFRKPFVVGELRAAVREAFAPASA